jgi:hypothetical protein
MPIVNNQSWDSDGNLVLDEWVEMPYPALSGHQVVATLNAVLELWTLTDAANVAGVELAHLIAEAQAWAVSEAMSDVSQ